MSTKKITVGGIAIDVVRKDIKNLHLGVYPPNGRVRIAAPMRFKDDAIRVFATSKIPWIKKQKAGFSGQERQTKREYVSGETHYFHGRRYILKVIYEDAPPRVKLQKQTHIVLFVRPKSSLAKREEVLTEWYRAELKKDIPDLINKWESKLGVEVSFWGIKKMNTRWGTCARKSRRIWVNLELAKKPKHCLEFIILHEMVHLLERSHNDRFIKPRDPWWAGRDSNPRSQRHLVYSQTRLTTSVPTH